MTRFIKANVASFVASGCDFLITIFVREIFRVDPVISSAIGTISGGVINFYIGRNWVFKAQHTSVIYQSKRYFITWTGNLLLNTLGVYLFIHMAELDYITAKVITSIIVAVGYNYPVQKRYVFKLIDKEDGQ